jgi:hypothetical protein
VIRFLFAYARVGLTAMALLSLAGLGQMGAGASIGGAPPVAAAAQDDPAALAVGLRALNDFAAASATALAAGDSDGARTAYMAFDDGWDAIEDGVRARSRDDYRSIEAAMREVAAALRDPVDTASANQWLGELQNRVNSFVATLPGS